MTTTTEANFYSTFLEKNDEPFSNFRTNFVNGRVIEKLSPAIRETAQRARFICEEARRQKAYACECARLTNVLYQEAFEKMTKGDLSTRALAIIKHGDKLDRLFKEPGRASPALSLGLKGSIPLDRYVVQQGHTGTANPPRFVYDLENPKALAVFKTRNSALIHRTVPTNQSHRRQVAAYLIDRLNGGYVGVPFTLIGKIGKEKGSVQIYKKHEGTLYNLVRCKLDTNTPTKDFSLQELQLITIHRSRLYDLDSHLGNVLFKRSKDGTVKLIPIDMEYSLPRIQNEQDVNDSRLRICWAYYPQMYNPLSSELKNYVLSLDPYQDAQILEELKFPKSCVRLLKATTWLWQEGAKRNMLPASIIEVLGSKQFKELLIPPTFTDDHNLKVKISKLMNEYIDYINPFIIKFNSAFQEAKTTENLTLLKEAIFEVSEKSPYLFYRLLRFILQEFPSDKAKEILQVFKEKGAPLNFHDVREIANIALPSLD